VDTTAVPSTAAAAADGRAESRAPLAIAALVCGILAVAVSILWPIGLVLGVLALSFAGVSRWGRRRDRSAMVTAGLWLGAAGLVLSTAFGVLFLTGTFDREPRVVCELQSQGTVACRQE
jgi:hypothetical protein